jgi:hypothetical protein
VRRPGDRSVFHHLGKIGYKAAAQIHYPNGAYRNRRRGRQYPREPEVAKAFGLVVGRMQGSTKELAFHAIAHPLDWPDRPRLWAAAGLLPIPVRKCAYEPGGEGERAAR